MEKIENLMKKILTKEVIFYIIFGILTTIVNLGSFFVMNDILNWNAYITNKDLVFHSEAKTSKEKITQFLKFILGRAFTMVVEFVGGLILFTLPIPNIITKAGLTVIVIILNFFISKFFAFKSKKN